ncbi:uncharacterized protein MONOS_10356 [Monocercomonoides exilis]|uniref:uncharacterized protein n=1 Tax=Monocercomonoides exilis TaxID=2049356 RepID=UPI00355AC509|nr:hypothetical protein MONOS_10356 [Monocercomonoides exilis]|eukprot:MONOS_10356.1-p1 / transcript=MONOS_10356.1 / gene=MONOS_10356 / organism=Monocercomonoides_exilis_PA203 / gene_product=unspecified product / transcript_product=unspecified product / location=Mono_scaffold00467:23880-32740(+) / protein_length=2890 / sequence_SO=supercontig / SO=protein_coding / is_pseudo=false
MEALFAFLQKATAERGGGISVDISGDGTASLVVTVSNCRFEGCSAGSQAANGKFGRGGGMSVYRRGTGNTLSLNVLSTVFVGNKAERDVEVTSDTNANDVGLGGGCYLDVEDINPTTNAVKVLFQKCTLTSATTNQLNNAAFGKGIFVCANSITDAVTAEWFYECFAERGLDAAVQHTLSAIKSTSQKTGDIIDLVKKLTYLSTTIYTGRASLTTEEEMAKKQKGTDRFYCGSDMRPCMTVDYGLSHHSAEGSVQSPNVLVVVRSATLTSPVDLSSNTIQSSTCNENEPSSPTLQGDANAWKREEEWRRIRESEIVVAGKDMAAIPSSGRVFNIAGSVSFNSIRFVFPIAIGTNDDVKELFGCEAVTAVPAANDVSLSFTFCTFYPTGTSDPSSSSSSSSDTTTIPYSLVVLRQGTLSLTQTRINATSSAVTVAKQKRNFYFAKSLFVVHWEENLRVEWVNVRINNITITAGAVLDVTKERVANGASLTSTRNASPSISLQSCHFEWISRTQSGSAVFSSLQTVDTVYSFSSCKLIDINSTLSTRGGASRLVLTEHGSLTVEQCSFIRCRCGSNATGRGGAMYVDCIGSRGSGDSDDWPEEDDSVVWSVNLRFEDCVMVNNTALYGKHVFLHLKNLNDQITDSMFDMDLGDEELFTYSQSALMADDAVNTTLTASNVLNSIKFESHQVYVSSTGNGRDSNQCGASGSPCRTISEAVKHIRGNTNRIVCLKNSAVIETPVEMNGFDFLRIQSSAADTHRTTPLVFSENSTVSSAGAASPANGPALLFVSGEVNFSFVEFAVPSEFLTVSGKTVKYLISSSESVSEGNKKIVLHRCSFKLNTTSSSSLSSSTFSGMNGPELSYSFFCIFSEEFEMNGCKLSNFAFASGFTPFFFAPSDLASINSCDATSIYDIKDSIFEYVSFPDSPQQKALLTMTLPSNAAKETRVKMNNCSFSSISSKGSLKGGALCISVEDPSASLSSSGSKHSAFSNEGTSSQHVSVTETTFTSCSASVDDKDTSSSTAGRGGGLYVSFKASFLPNEMPFAGIDFTTNEASIGRDLFLCIPNIGAQVKHELFTDAFHSGYDCSLSPLYGAELADGSQGTDIDLIQYLKYEDNRICVTSAASTAASTLSSTSLTNLHLSIENRHSFESRLRKRNEEVTGSDWFLCGSKNLPCASFGYAVCHLTGASKELVILNKLHTTKKIIVKGITVAAAQAVDWGNEQPEDASSNKRAVLSFASSLGEAATDECSNLLDCPISSSTNTESSSARSATNTPNYAVFVSENGAHFKSIEFQLPSTAAFDASYEAFICSSLNSDSGYLSLDDCSFTVGAATSFTSSSSRQMSNAAEIAFPLLSTITGAVTLTSCFINKLSFSTSPVVYSSASGDFHLVNCHFSELTLKSSLFSLTRATSAAANSLSETNSLLSQANSATLSFSGCKFCGITSSSASAAVISSAEGTSALKATSSNAFSNPNSETKIPPIDINSCSFVDCTSPSATAGGAIALKLQADESVSIYDCLFVRCGCNEQTGKGGAIYLDVTSADQSELNTMMVVSMPRFALNKAAKGRDLFVLLNDPKKVNEETIIIDTKQRVEVPAEGCVADPENYAVLSNVEYDRTNSMCYCNASSGTCQSDSQMGDLFEVIEQRSTEVYADKTGIESGNDKKCGAAETPCKTIEGGLERLLKNKKRTLIVKDSLDVSKCLKMDDTIIISASAYRLPQGSTSDSASQANIQVSKTIESSSFNEALFSVSSSSDQSVTVPLASSVTKFSSLKFLLPLKMTNSEGTVQIKKIIFCSKGMLIIENVAFEMNESFENDNVLYSFISSKYSNVFINEFSFIATKSTKDKLLPTPSCPLILDSVPSAASISHLIFNNIKVTDAFPAVLVKFSQPQTPAAHAGTQTDPQPFFLMEYSSFTNIANAGSTGDQLPAALSLESDIVLEMRISSCVFDNCQSTNSKKGGAMYVNVKNPASSQLGSSFNSAKQAFKQASADPSDEEKKLLIISDCSFTNCKTESTDSSNGNAIYLDFESFGSSVTKPIPFLLSSLKFTECKTESVPVVQINCGGDTSKQLVDSQFNIDWNQFDADNVSGLIQSCQGSSCTDMLDEVLQFKSQSVCISSASSPGSDPDEVFKRTCGSALKPCKDIAMGLPHVMNGAVRKLAVMDAIIISEETDLEDVTITSHSTTSALSSLSNSVINQAATLSELQLSQTVQQPDDSRLTIISCTDSVVAMEKIAIVISDTLISTHSAVFGVESGTLRFKESEITPKTASSSSSASSNYILSQIACSNQDAPSVSMRMSLVLAEGGVVEMEHCKINDLAFRDDVNAIVLRNNHNAFFDHLDAKNLLFTGGTMINILSSEVVLSDTQNTANSDGNEDEQPPEDLPKVTITFKGCTFEGISSTSATPSTEAFVNPSVLRFAHPNEDDDGNSSIWLPWLPTNTSKDDGNSTNETKLVYVPEFSFVLENVISTNCAYRAPLRDEERVIGEEDSADEDEEIEVVGSVMSIHGSKVEMKGCQFDERVTTAAKAQYNAKTNSFGQFKTKYLSDTLTEHDGECDSCICAVGTASVVHLKDCQAHLNDVQFLGARDYALSVDSGSLTIDKYNFKENGMLQKGECPTPISKSYSNSNAMLNSSPESNAASSRFPSLRKNIVCTGSGSVNVNSLDLGSDGAAANSSLWIQSNNCTLGGIAKRRMSPLFIPSLSSISRTKSGINSTITFKGNNMIPCNLTFEVLHREGEWVDPVHNEEADEDPDNDYIDDWTTLYGPFTFTSNPSEFEAVGVIQSNYLDFADSGTSVVIRLGFGVGSHGWRRRTAALVIKAADISNGDGEKPGLSKTGIILISVLVPVFFVATVVAIVVVVCVVRKKKLNKAEVKEQDPKEIEMEAVPWAPQVVEE